MTTVKIDMFIHGKKMSADNLQLLEQLAGGQDQVMYVQKDANGNLMEQGVYKIEKVCLSRTSK